MLAGAEGSGHQRQLPGSLEFETIKIESPVIDFGRALNCIPTTVEPAVAHRDLQSRNTHRIIIGAPDNCVERPGARQNFEGYEPVAKSTEAPFDFTCKFHRQFGRKADACHVKK